MQSDESVESPTLCMFISLSLPVTQPCNALQPITRVPACVLPALISTSRLQQVVIVSVLRSKAHSFFISLSSVSHPSLHCQFLCCSLYYLSVSGTKRRSFSRVPHPGFRAGVRATVKPLIDSVNRRNTPSTHGYPVDLSLIHI